MSECDGVRVSGGEVKEAKKEKAKPFENVFTVATHCKPHLQTIMHQYPLYRISYCADDKVERQFISFIVKEQDSEQHTCFVFLSDKLSEEITVTIGQAFELAYK